MLRGFVRVHGAWVRLFNSDEVTDASTQEGEEHIRIAALLRNNNFT